MTKSRLSLLFCAIIFILSSGFETAVAQTSLGVDVSLNFQNSNFKGKGLKGFSIGPKVHKILSRKWFGEASLRISSQPVMTETFWCAEITPTEFKPYPTYTEPINHDNLTLSPYYLTLPVRLGFVMPFPGNTNLNIAAGPVLGYGLWGKGQYETYSAKPGNYTADLVSKIESDNIFNPKQPLQIASTRLEYGLTLRVGLKLGKHMDLGIEQNYLYLPAGDSFSQSQANIITDYSLTAVNISYYF